MATVSRLKLGPADHGRALAYDDFMAAEYAPGYKYEIIDGRLYVSPLPNLPENRVENWLQTKLFRYSDQHPEVINYLTAKSRVFVLNRPGITVPEPDLTAYHDFPVDLSLAELRWEDVRPVLVIEVLCGDDPNKDLVRNVELYFQVPTIKEYWVVDARENPDQPTLIVHRRHGKRWRVSRFTYGETYTTKLLPGFELLIDPRRR